MRTLVFLAVGALVTGCSRTAPLEFADAETLEHFTPVGAAPMFAAMPDGREVIAWVSAPDSGSHGRLYISVGGAPPTELTDPLGPIEMHTEAPPKVAVSTDGAVHAIYVVGKEVPGRRFPLSALRYLQSRDEGRTWSVPRTVTDGAEFGSHNFHALAVGPDGRVLVSWLDGRTGASNAFVAVSSDNGASWGANVRVDTTATCPCCRTGLAVGRDGTMYLAWRSILPGGIRDIVVARSSDDGRTWSKPVRVHEDNWVFNGCPHAGPSMHVDSGGRVHIAWWTGRDSAAGVWYARSDDKAASFGTVVPLDIADFSRPAHVQLALAGDTVVAVWDDGTVEVPRVLLRRSIDGGTSFSAAILLSDSTRASTFPVVALTPRGTAVAWSEQGLVSQLHNHNQPDMKDPGAVRKLARVGDARIIVRREGRHRP